MSADDHATAKERREVARRATIDALNHARGSVADAARALGVAHRSLEDRLLAWPASDGGAPGTLRAWLDRTWPLARTSGPRPTRAPTTAGARRPARQSRWR